MSNDTEIFIVTVVCDIHCLDSVYLEDAGNETKVINLCQMTCVSMTLLFHWAVYIQSVFLLSIPITSCMTFQKILLSSRQLKYM